MIVRHIEDSRKGNGIADAGRGIDGQPERVAIGKIGILANFLARPRKDQLKFGISRSKINQIEIISENRRTG